MLADLPLALAVDLQPGAVEDQVERPGGLLRQRDADGGGPAAEGGVVGHGQVHPHQLEERAGEPLGGPQGEVVDGPERQQALDGQVAVLELGPPLARPLVSPRLERLLIDPEGERAPVGPGRRCTASSCGCGRRASGRLGERASWVRVVGCRGSGPADRPSIPKSTSPPKPFVQQRPFDCYFTNAEILNHIHEKKDRFGTARGYVGDLKTNRKLEWKGQILKASELAASIPAEDRKELRIGDGRQWYFTVTVRIPEVKHKVRIVILWQYRHDEQCCKILVTNRITWEVSRIVRVYRHRWTGTETFHRDGKQQLGLGDCQLRDAQGQTRHMYLVMLAYSLLMGQLRQGRAKEWALHRLMTIGEACRAMVKESLRTTLAWAIEQVTERGLSFERVVAQLSIT